MHTSDSAEIVEWNDLLDSRWILYGATAYTPVHSKATAIQIEYTKNVQRNQSTMKPKLVWAILTCWNLETWTPNHARHSMVASSVEQATHFSEDEIEQTL